jgi:stearoyl-CoA desaturase (delta-9 desaturase)
MKSYKRIITNIFASNTEYLPYIQLAATASVLAFIVFSEQTLNLWLISILMYAFIGCFGISIGYHRLLTHKSFKTTKFWERFCTLWGMLAFTGSSIGWVGMHKDHHRFSDKPGDPHSPLNNGWRMLVASYDYEPDKWKIRNLIFDKFHVFVHTWYFAILLAWIAFWAAIGGSVLAMHVVVIPAVISVWISTTSNYMNHMWGYRNFVTTDNSRNLWINAVVTFGEGWHNNHHARPGNYDFGSGTSGKWWEFDMAARVIDLIKK